MLDNTQSGNLNGMLGSWHNQNLPKFITMSVKDFLEMEMYRGNRNSENRVKKLVPVLKNPRATSLVVSVGVLDGKQYRVDGNTRAFAWKRAKEFKLEVPDQVVAIVYECNTHEELHTLYNTLDNFKGAETASDKMAGLFRLAGKDPMTFISKKLQNGQVVKAIKNGFAHLRIDLDKPEQSIPKIKPLIPYLEMLDPFIAAKDSRMHAADLCSAMMMLQKYEENLYAIERILHGFENLTQRAVDHMSPAGMDAISYLHLVMGKHWGASWGYTNGRQMPIEVGCSLYYFEQWMKHEIINDGPKEGFEDWLKNWKKETEAIIKERNERNK